MNQQRTAKRVIYLYEHCQLSFFTKRTENRGHYLGRTHLKRTIESQMRIRCAYRVRQKSLKDDASNKQTRPSMEPSFPSSSSTNAAQQSPLNRSFLRQRLSRSICRRTVWDFPVLWEAHFSSNDENSIVSVEAFGVKRLSTSTFSVHRCYWE